MGTWHFVTTGTGSVDDTKLLGASLELKIWGGGGNAQALLGKKGWVTGLPGDSKHSPSISDKTAQNNKLPHATILLYSL